MSLKICLHQYGAYLVQKVVLPSHMIYIYFRRVCSDNVGIVCGFHYVFLCQNNGFNMFDDVVLNCNTAKG